MSDLPNTDQSSSSVELTSEQKKQLFEEFRMEQKKLLEEAEKKRAAALVGVSANSGGVDGGAKTPDEPSPEFSGSKPEPKSKKRKLDDEISLPNSESEFTLDGDGADDRHDAQAKATNEWLSKYLSGTATSDDQNNEEVFSTHGGEDFFVEEAHLTDEGKGEKLSKEMEGIMRSRYKAIMEHTKEKMGDPVVPNIEGLVSVSWGKSRLAAKTKTDLQEKIPIPINCAPMKAPKLNTEVYIRVYENATSKDEALKKSQNDIAKATVPILRAMGDMEKMEAVLTKQLKGKKKEEITQEEKFLYQTTKSSLKQLTTSVLMLNYNFTEITRKRKYDVCGVLGAAFRPYAAAEDTGEYLFGVETMKAMKKELTKVNVKVKKDFYPSKNFKAPGKAPRSHHSGDFRSYNNRNNYNGNRNYNQNNGHNQNNHNNNNHNNYNNYNRNQQSRNRGRGRNGR